MRKVSESCVVLETKKEILARLAKPGKVYVHTPFGAEFPIEKQAAKEHARYNPCELYCWSNGDMKLEDRSNSFDEWDEKISAAYFA